jgi:acetyl-CoA carboxylase carboxyltransferase component
LLYGSNKIQDFCFHGDGVIANCRRHDKLLAPQNVIRPQNTRWQLSRALSLLNNKKVERPPLAQAR